MLEHIEFDYDKRGTIRVNPYLGVFTQHFNGFPIANDWWLKGSVIFHFRGAGPRGTYNWLVK